MQKYYSRIEKSNLSINNVSNIYFIYNAQQIKIEDYSKTICEYFKTSNILIQVAKKYKKLEYEIIEPIR